MSVDIHVYIHEDSTRSSSTNHKLEEIMADLEGLTTAVNNLIDSEHTAATELQKLSDLVKSLSVGNVTQDQIDAITTAVTQVATNLNSDVADADAGQDKPPTGAMDPIETEAVDAPSVAASTGKRSRNP